MVVDRTTGESFLLSNNHVLAHSNAGLQGDPILQPGPIDGGQNPADVVARLERFIPITFIDDPSQPPTPTPPPEPEPGNGSEPTGCLAAVTGLSKLLGSVSGGRKTTTTASAVGSPAAVIRMVTTAQAATATNVADCALARPVNPAMFTDDILNIGIVSGVKTPTLGMQVRKSGRTTGLTQSTVTLLNATVDVGYVTNQGDRTARFTGQIICEPMSQGGDSGSLVVDFDNHAVGLLFAGSNLSTIFTPIEIVLNALNVKFK